MADSDRPGHGIGMAVEETVGGVGVTVSYLVVATLYVYDYEFPFLFRVYQRSDIPFVEFRATSGQVCRDQTL